MDMEIAATGTYPPPADWGKSMKTDYYLDEWGALYGFNGGGYPFPEIKPDDPLAALKVYWNTILLLHSQGQGRSLPSRIPHSLRRTQILGQAFRSRSAPTPPSA